MNSEDLNKSLGKKNPERKIMDEEDRDSMPDLEVLEKIVDKELVKRDTMHLDFQLFITH